jgi:hypothetical protein
MTLTMDRASERRFKNGLRRAVAIMCGTRVTVTSTSRITIKARISRELDFITGSVRATLHGRTRFGSGSARYYAGFDGLFYPDGIDPIDDEFE